MFTNHNHHLMVALSTYPFLWCLIAEVKSCGVPIHSNIGISDESSVFPTINFTASAKSKGRKMIYWRMESLWKNLNFLYQKYSTFLSWVHSLSWASNLRLINAWIYINIIIIISGKHAYHFSSLCFFSAVDSHF